MFRSFNNKGQFLWAIVIVYLIAFVLFLGLIRRRDKGILDDMEEYQTFKEPDYFTRIKKSDEEKPRSGYLTILDSREAISNIPFVVTKKGIREKSQYEKYLKINPYLIGRGIDKAYRPGSAYFLNYAPFKTDKVWVPLVALSKRLRYRSDNYLGIIPDDAWQTSRYSYRYRKGDCEDHAILLADWFNAMGYDARVVIGDHYFSCHAWVILFFDNKEYLIEATKKNREKKFNVVFNKLAYQPMVMFNQKYFWINKGSRLRTSYAGGGWQKVAEFEEN